jgi:putative hydrolase of the HAD superfamily
MSPSYSPLKTMPTLRAVVFDLDDTLYPERSYVLSGFRAVAAWAEGQLGIPYSTGFAVLHDLFASGVRGNTFNRWLEHFGRDSTTERISQLVHVYREHQPDISPYSDVAELLPRLRARYRLGLVSDGYLAVQRNKWTSLCLSAYFDGVVFSDELGPQAWKPSPQPFTTVLLKFSIVGKDAVYVADNPRKDFLGAKQVGMRTIRVRRVEGLYHAEEPPSPAHAPEVEIQNLTQLENVLSQIGGSY